MRALRPWPLGSRTPVTQVLQFNGKTDPGGRRFGRAFLDEMADTGQDDPWSIRPRILEATDGEIQRQGPVGRAIDSGHHRIVYNSVC